MVLTFAYKTTLMQKNNVIFSILSVMYIFRFNFRNLHIFKDNFYVVYIFTFIFRNLHITKHNFYVVHIFTFFFRNSVNFSCIKKYIVRVCKNIKSIFSFSAALISPLEGIVVKSLTKEKALAEGFVVPF